MATEQIRGSVTLFLVRARYLAAALVYLAGLALAALTPQPASAQRFETSAGQAILLDADSGTVLFQHEADTQMAPASMAKLMTVAVVFKALKSGELSLDDEFVVSEDAWRRGGAVARGSTMFAELGSTINLNDLLRGIIVQSGNDACIVVAEAMGGSEAVFAEMMNAEARRIGLENSNFTNATGLPDPNQRVTARDLAKLADYIIKTYPEYYKIYSEESFTWNKITQRNRNPLLSMNIGADGLKTGFTEESGYGLVGSAVRDGQRLILVINGTDSDKARATEARKLIDWGFRAFERTVIFDADEVVAEAKVFGGTQRSVGLVGDGPIELLLPHGSRDSIRGRVVYNAPVSAPIAKGQEIATLRLTVGDDLSKEAKLYAEKNVGIGTTRQRALDGIEELLIGWW